MFDVKLFCDATYVYICVLYEGKWYSKRTATRDGKAVAGTDYAPIEDAEMLKTLDKLPSLLETITKQP